MTRLPDNFVNSIRDISISDDNNEPPNTIMHGEFVRHCGVVVLSFVQSDEYPIVNNFAQNSIRVCIVGLVQ